MDRIEERRKRKKSKSDWKGIKRVSLRFSRSSSAATYKQTQKG
jgi:hypothetical protein